METEPNMAKEAITHPIATTKIDTVKEKYKPQTSKSKKYKSIGNKWEKSRSLDKSRYTQGTETEDTVKTLNKSRYISSDSFSDNSTPKKPKK